MSGWVELKLNILFDTDKLITYLLTELENLIDNLMSTIYFINEIIKQMQTSLTSLKLHFIPEIHPLGSAVWLDFWLGLDQRLKMGCSKEEETVRDNIIQSWFWSESNLQCVFFKTWFWDTFDQKKVNSGTKCNKNV